ncbi:MAG: hypothetical protein ACRCU3_09140 [Eubacteriaceae bacterium]
MKFYTKMLIGLGVILGGYLISLIIWFLSSSNFYIDQETTLFYATIFQVLSVLPSIIIYCLWYRRLVNISPKERAKKEFSDLKILYIVLILIFTTVLTIVPSLVWLYISTIGYLVLNIVLITIAAAIAMFCFKPFN